MKKVNLGCGREIMEGFINVDVENYKGIDVIHDLNTYPLPFENGEFDEIIAKNIIEHLDRPHQFVKELWRIAKDGARVFIQAPHYSNFGVWGDLTHKKGYSFFSLRHYNIDRKYTNSLVANKEVFEIITKIDFSKIFRPIQYLANKFPLIYESFFSYIFNARTVYYELKKRTTKSSNANNKISQSKSSTKSEDKE